MPGENFSTAGERRATRRLALVLLACLLSAATGVGAAGRGERLDGVYAREGNDGSPAATAGNNIYLKFFPDRWVGLLFVPYPYARELDPDVVNRVLLAARAQTDSASYLKGRFGLLDESATVQIERYGYLEDRIAFECGALSACTIRLGDGYLELVKPGVINEHIVRYNHVAAD